MDYTTLKQFHILFAIISISGFIGRGALAFYDSDLLQRRWLKVLPHINDTLLLLSAIALVIQSAYHPLHHAWLAGKIILLVFYIGFGFMALRFAKSRRRRILFFCLAIVTFAGIVTMAISKSLVLF